MVLVVALVVLRIAVKKLGKDKEVTMNKSEMAVPAVLAVLEVGEAIGASCAANAVPA